MAVHVRLDDAQHVLAGHYAERARDAQITASAAEAVRRIAVLEDPRGWEVFVPRAIRPGEVHKIRAAPQVAGWRYRPDAHGVRPCTCLGCRERGGYGARRLLQRLPHPRDGPDDGCLRNAPTPARRRSRLSTLIGTSGGG